MDKELQILLKSIGHLVYDWESLHDNTVVGCYVEWPVGGAVVYQWDGENMHKAEGCTVAIEPLSKTQ